MGIRAQDLENENLETARQKAEAAMGGSDPKAVVDGMVDIAQSAAGKAAKQAMEETLALFEELRSETDQNVIMERGGLRRLSQKETEFYQKYIAAASSRNPRQEVNNLDVVMPQTVIEAVFEDMGTEHPLLSRIDFTYSGAAIKMVTNTNGYQEAAWGPLCSDIVQELTSGFRQIEATLYKLSAFIPVCKAMLDLGPAWLDRYVRRVLGIALLNGWERGIVMGNGKDQPIGMIRQVGDDVTTTGGVYPEKAAIKVTDFSLATFGNLVSILAAGPNGNPRPVNDLILLVNPQDYYQKIGPATRMLTANGTYVDVTPYPMDIIQSVVLPRGKAVFGIAKRYQAFAGMNEDGRIEYSDDYRFLEDERVYIIKTYGNGFPLDNNAFLLLDISGLKPATYHVTVENPGEPSADAELSDLKIGSLSLSPAFSASTTSYTATTSNATNTINAIPADAGAAIQVLVNDEEINNGTAAAWQNGSNTVKITVTAPDGTTTTPYTVTVTRNGGV